MRLMKYSQQSSRSPVAELKEDFSDVDKECFSALNSGTEMDFAISCMVVTTIVRPE